MKRTVKKTLSLLCVLALTLALFAACGSPDGNGSDAAQGGEADAPASDPAETDLEDNDGEEPEQPAEKTAVAVGALKGPTGMGMARLMEQAEQGETANDYRFTMDSAPDVIQGKIVSGELDIAALPTNVAAVLYNRTEGGVKLLAINTLGVLYIVQGPDAGVTSIEDLAGKTIFSAGQGSTQEYVINHLLAEAGLTDSVTIEYRSDHAEVTTLLLSGECDVALLPQPHVTTATLRDETVSIALDITEEWEKLSGGAELTMGSLVIRTEFLEQNPEAVALFLDEYRASTAFANDNVDEAARIIGELDIVPAEVARIAIPDCNIVCITGAEMAASAGSYLQAIAGQNPTAVGGELPDEGFYHIP